MKTKAKNEDKIEEFNKAQKKFKLDQALLDQITQYFSKRLDEFDVELEKNEEMTYLMKILPPTLSVRLGLFLYSDAIAVHGFL